MKPFKYENELGICRMLRVIASLVVVIIAYLHVFTFAHSAAYAASLAPKWISGGTDAPESPAPTLVREFALDAKPTSAVFTVAVAGWCEVYVNGTKVGRDVLSPVTCQPDMRNSSLDFDIAGMLKAGTNTLEVLLGNGWQNMFTVGWGFPDAPWRGCPKIRGEMKCDGQTLFVTDGAWRVYDSPIVFNALRNGEWYDARMEGRRVNERGAKVEMTVSNTSDRPLAHARRKPPRVVRGDVRRQGARSWTSRRAARHEVPRGWRLARVGVRPVRQAERRQPRSISEMESSFR